MLDAPRQITIEDAILEVERDRRISEQEGPIELEQLGESFEFGYAILGLLERNDWFVHVTVPFGGQLENGERGVMIVAAHKYADVPDLRICGRSVADCATTLMVEAGKHVRTIANARARRHAAA